MKEPIPNKINKPAHPGSFNTTQANPATMQMAGKVVALTLKLKFINLSIGWSIK
jgi:hypothetical protein